MPQSRVKVKETRSGSSPRCLASLHDLGQSVSGFSISHLSGASGQLALVIGSALASVCVSTLSMSDLKTVCRQNVLLDR